MPAEKDMNSWVRAAVPCGVFLAAVAVLAWGIQNPPMLVFDEHWYVEAGRAMVDGIWFNPYFEDQRPVNREHPPTAKYLIALGIQINGDPHSSVSTARYASDMCRLKPNPECAPDTMGWRLFPVFFGASGVAAAYLLALRLFGSVTPGLVAAFLLLTDGMYVLHSRLAMLDIFATALVVWCFAFLFAPYPGGRWVASVLFGLAASAKFSALFLLPAFLLVHWSRRKKFNSMNLGLNSVEGLQLERRARWAWLWSAPRRFAPWLLAVAGVPAIVYFASYLPYLLLWAQTGGPWYALARLVTVQYDALAWNLASPLYQKNASFPLTWIAMTKPLWYYYVSYADGRVAVIGTFGNLATWWGAIASVVYVTGSAGMKAFKRWAGAGPGFAWRRWRAAFAVPSNEMPVVLCAVLFWSAYLPWFLIQRPVFLFYMTFVVPWMVLALAAQLASPLKSRRPGTRNFAIGYLALVLGVAILYFPVTRAIPVPLEFVKFVIDLIPWMTPN